LEGITRDPATSLDSGAGLSRYPTRASASAVPSDPAAPGYMLKRPIETILAAVGFIILVPVCLVVAAAVWLEDRGPIFVHQIRVGRFGVPFRVVKFRTMRAVRPAAIHRQATVQDSRITGVGRVLRAMALDEIPQLVN